MLADLWKTLCLAALCLTASAPRVQAQTPEPAAATPASPASPSDRLKARDPQQRWKELNEPSVEGRTRTRRAAVPRLAEQPTAEAAPAEKEPDQPIYRNVSAPLPPKVAGGRRMLERPAAAPVETEASFATAPASEEEITPVYEVGMQDLDNPSEPVALDPKQLKKLTAIMPYYDYVPDASLRDQGSGFPEDPPISADPFIPRAFPSEGYFWTAADTYHNPLYFDDNPLERYGHTRPFYIQPVVSVGKMVCQTFFLPYQMTMNPPWRKHYTLGSYRPGACVPYRYYQVPLDARAAAVQAGAVTGGFFLFGLY